MNTTNILLYRHFDVERDFAPLVTLLGEVEQADHDGEDVSEAMLREQLSWPGHNPALDRWVVTCSDSNALIGYGTLFKTPDDGSADLYIAVHPAWRRHGIGNQLLLSLLERAREMGSEDIRAYAAAQHQAAKVFLRQHGFDLVAAYTRMAVAGTHPFPAPELPAQFVVRSYNQVQQMELFLEATNRGYEGLWGHRHINQEELEAWFPQLQKEGIFLLFAPDGAIAGICRAEISEHLTALRGVSTGLIDAPGVVPHYRKSGLYLPLVLTALQWLVPQSPVQIELESWGDAASTLATYRTMGFTPIQEAISYRRSLI